MTPPNVLDRAADLLAETGWCRGYYEDGSGRHCLIGVLRKAAGHRYDWWAVREECEARYGRSILTANDEHIRNQAEAIDVLRAAARRLDGGA